MPTREELLAEAYKRGLLKGEKKDAYEEAMRRGLVQQTEEAPSGFMEQVKSVFTGEGRTEFPDMPEFSFPTPKRDRLQPLSTGEGRLREDQRAIIAQFGTFDEERQKNLLKKAYPDLAFSNDKYGNVIVDSSAYGGDQSYLNKPGVSSSDVARFGVQSAAFAPAGGVGGYMGQAGRGLLPRMLGVGSGSAATQAALDVGSQDAGGTEDVSLSNVNLTDVAIAGGAGGAFEGLAGPLGKLAKKLLPRFKRNPTITDSIRAQVRHAAKRAGRDPDEVTDEFISSWLRSADEAQGGGRSVASREAAQQLDEFPDLVYTRGQASGDLRQLELEDTMRHVGGTRAQKIMRDFDVKQQRGIASETEKLQRGLGGDVVERPNQAAAAAKESIQSKASLLDEAIGDAYEQVGDAYLSAEGQKELARRILSLRRSPEWITEPGLAPATSSAMKRISNLSDMIKQGAELKPAHVKRLESFRRYLNNVRQSAPNPSDARQVGIIKREFDRYLDEAIDNALFSGDTNAIDALKKARGLRAEYRKKFGQSPKINKGREFKDVAGDIMERIVGADPTDEQVANYLFGASKLGSKQGSAQLAKRMKTTLGADSPEWGSIRQAAFLKLTKPKKGSEVVSARDFLSRLDEATKGSGETFMKELFTPQEIGKMRRLGEAVIRAQPEIGNPSRSSYKAAAMVKQLAEDTARLLGWGSGPGGGVGAEAGIQGVQALGGLREAAKAARAIDIRPFAHLTAAPAVGAPSALSASQD